MKNVFAVVALLTSISAFASSGVAPSSSCAPQLLKKSKILFDLNQLKDFDLAACRDPGVSCSSSADCCGSSMCNDGYCSDPGSNNLPPGAHCASSSECQGASMCRDGYCTDPGYNNIPPGGRCASSSECEGASMCRDGFCTDPGYNNIPPGGHCSSSNECMGSSWCQNNVCS